MRITVRLMPRKIKSSLHELRLRDAHIRDAERRVLFVGSSSDIARAAESLRRSGLELERSSASNVDEARKAIEQGEWSAIIADYDLDVLQIARAAAPEVPLLLVIDPKDEARAIEALRNGAADYVCKDRLGRLAPAVRREVEAAAARERAAQNVGRVAATVAHDFNNILMGIASFVHVIRRASSPEKIETALDHIAKAVSRGRSMTEDVLRYTDPAEPVRAMVDVAAWLRAVDNEARMMLGPAHCIAIDAESLRMDADASQLQQILLALLLQARDSMPSGGEITLSARREPKDASFAFGVVDDPSRYVHFTISDKGRGYGEEVLRHAFEPLSTTKRGGMGFGVAVAQQVVLRHDGEIFVESTPGEGTAFHLFIPLASRREILVVDDDPLVSTGIAMLLEEEGYAVSCVTTGQDALDSLRRSVPDAVVLDVGLPDMDGRVVFAAIAQMHPTLPVVFSTGHADRTRLEEFLVEPHVACLMKPYAFAALTEALATVLDA